MGAVRPSLGGRASLGVGRLAIHYLWRGLSPPILRQHSALGHTRPNLQGSPPACFAHRPESAWQFDRPIRHHAPFYLYTQAVTSGGRLRCDEGLSGAARKTHDAAHEETGGKLYHRMTD